MPHWGFVDVFIIIYSPFFIASIIDIPSFLNLLRSCTITSLSVSLEKVTFYKYWALIVGYPPIIPLWTRKILWSISKWGWAFFSTFSPQVAHLVCPIPMWDLTICFETWSVSLSMQLNCSPFYSAFLIKLCSTFSSSLENTTMPALSYPRFFNNSTPSEREGAILFSFFETIPIIPQH